MARVTPTEVKNILDNSQLSDATVQVFIDSATTIIDSVFASETVLSVTQLKEIERWLTAHLIASTIERTTEEEKLGEATVKYTGKYGELLKLTPYGQNALLLDVTGKLGAYAGKSVARIIAVKSFE